METSTSPAGSHPGVQDAHHLEPSDGGAVAGSRNTTRLAEQNQNLSGVKAAYESRDRSAGNPNLAPEALPASAHTSVSGLASSSVKALVDAAMSGIREDVRSLHIEVLRQTHMSQAEQQQLFARVLANQDAMLSRLEALERKVDGFVSGAKGPVSGLF